MNKGGGMRHLALMVLWPSFLVAALAEGFFFSLFDPGELAQLSTDLPLSPRAVYTIGFFLFWAVCALASLLSCYLALVPNNGKQPF
jgi:hypothetical protein